MLLLLKLVTKIKVLRTAFIDGLPIRGGEKVVIEVEDATQQPITLRNPLRVNKIGKATPGTRQDVYVLDLATDEISFE